ncbi:MAG: hypothetical protein P4L98_24570 [Ancalomicrobiaceae bacterium]|nr:hypothetical protein [Ancalomicrobiaceae bacterium]
MTPDKTPKQPINSRIWSRRVSPRSVAEAIATILIVAGVVMLMQPISLTLYSYSFTVTLLGTALFVVGSKLPD